MNTSVRRAVPALLVMLAVVVSALASPAAASVPTFWVPAQKATWAIQYAGTLDLTRPVSVYDTDWEDTTAAQVATLSAAGKKAICYFSAGSWENWRSDAPAFPASVKGKSLSGWAGEKWLDVRQLSVLLPIMGARMDVCKAKGFAAVDPDNVDGYQNATGFPLTTAHAVAYLRALSTMAHDRGMSIGLKNATDIIGQVQPVMDFAVNEECVAYSECSTYGPFGAAGKAVFHIEYSGTMAKVCSRPAYFSTLKKRLTLNADVLGTCS